MVEKIYEPVLVGEPLDREEVQELITSRVRDVNGEASAACAGVMRRARGMNRKRGPQVITESRRRS